jgi:hypothetical protein
MDYDSVIEIKFDKIEDDVEFNDDADKNDIKNDDKIFIFEDINDKGDDDKIFTSDSRLHNGKPITMIEISPKENYLITYSKEDSSIVGWNVEDINKVQLKFDQTVQTVKINEDTIRSLCVSDDKKLAYINRNKNYNHTIGTKLSMYDEKYTTTGK